MFHPSADLASGPIIRCMDPRVMTKFVDATKSQMVTVGPLARCWLIDEWSEFMGPRCSYKSVP
jgi:hypothetical protein